MNGCPYYLNCITIHNSLFFHCYIQYADPNYQGGGIGEYEFYDQDSGEYKCYSDECRAKMDCHSSDSESWQLIGIFKIDKISQGDGWMEQLFKHAGVCYWGEDNFDFASKMRETLPNGCKQTDYKVNGNYLYVDVKPAQNAYISLALYTDKTCTKLYTGTDYDAYTAAGTSSDDMATFNTLLNAYRICQPCRAYDLGADDFSCSDKAGYTNCNQVRNSVSRIPILKHFKLNHFLLLFTRCCCFFYFIFCSARNLPSKLNVLLPLHKRSSRHIFSQASCQLVTLLTRLKRHKFRCLNLKYYMIRLKAFLAICKLQYCSFWHVSLYFLYQQMLTGKVIPRIAHLQRAAMREAQKPRLDLYMEIVHQLVPLA